MNGHGGRRTGAGRKKKQTTIIREKALADAGADAEYAFGLFVQGMRGELADKSIILYCAREVMDRVWGRSVQRREHSGPDGGPIQVDDARDRLTQLYNAQVAAIAAGEPASGADPGSGEGADL